MNHQYRTNRNYRNFQYTKGDRSLPADSRYSASGRNYDTEHRNAYNPKHRDKTNESGRKTTQPSRTRHGEQRRIEFEDPQEYNLSTNRKGGGRMTFAKKAM